VAEVISNPSSGPQTRENRIPSGASLGGVVQFRVTHIQFREADLVVRFDKFEILIQPE
jgi:hypothetical protein